jgi:magnesium transporter
MREEARNNHLLAGTDGDVAARMREFIEARQLHELRDLVASLPEATVADLLAGLPVEEQIVVFRILPHDHATEVFEFLDTDAQVALLNSLGSDRVAFFLNEMAADDRTALFEEMPTPLVRRLMGLLAKDERIIALSLLGYPEYSVGRLMTPDYLSVRPEWPVSEVLLYIRERGSLSDTLSVFFVCDEAGLLIGNINVGDLLLADPNATADTICDKNVVVLHPQDDQEVAANLFHRHGRPVLPVVDAAGILIGIVTMDDALEVAREEATEDIQKLGAVAALEEPYLKAPLARLIQSRALWLVVLFVGEMMTASAMALYEKEIERAVVLAVFVPLIISSGGNSGSQAASLVIRAMAIGEIRLSDWRRVLSRELASGFVLGSVLGILGLIRIAIWGGTFNSYGPHWLMIGFVVMISLIVVVLWGTIVGSMLPFVLRSLGADPATSSAPFVATLVDVIGLIAYFTVAALLLQGTLL